MSEFATVVLKNGTKYETPVENVDNIRRVLAGKFTQIIFPGDEEESTEVDTVEETPTPARKSKGKKK
jgi:hypothetical protein